MQFHMSSASAPGVAAPPLAPAAKPRLLEPSPKRPRHTGRWFLLLFVVSAAGLGLWMWQHSAAATRQSTQAQSSSARVATAFSGVIEQSIRLSGTTGAEKYVSLVTPQLRGNRNQRGRENTTQLASVAAPLVIQSNARSATASGASTNTTTSTSTDGSGSVSVTSTAGTSNSSGSQAFQSATSRVTRSSGTSSSSSSATSAATTSSTLGDSGIGSTGSQLAGTGFPGGGNNASEFGLVLQNCAKPGSLVKKGQTVGEFDRQFMLTRLEDYQASVVQQNESVRKLRGELIIARKAYDQRLEGAKADLDKAQLDVKTTPVLSRIEAEKIKLAAEEAQAQYEQVLGEKKFVEIGYAAQLRNAELDLEQARLELRRAQTNADRMLVKAPINGLAVMQTIFRGSEFGQVQAGDQLWPGMLFMQIVDPSSMVINATVNQVDVEKLRLGQKAHVRVDAYPGLELAAHIHSIGAMTKAGGMRASFVKEIPVILKIDEMDPRIIPDLSVSADVVIESEKAPAIVPQNSVFRDDSSHESFVYVKSSDDWERRPVQPGLMNQLSVAIRSGLKAGEVVAAEPPPVDRKKEQG